MKNNGEKDKYIVYDCHPAIIERDTYNRVQQEHARRGSIRKRSDKSETEQGHYARKYALSDILICGECGTAYRRVTWTSHGHKLIVWRCISRLDHGSKYCKNSPSINEEKLQTAIVDALNNVYADGKKLMKEMKHNLMLVMTDKDIAKSEIDKMEMRLREISLEEKILLIIFKPEKIKRNYAFLNFMCNMLIIRHLVLYFTALVAGQLTLDNGNKTCSNEWNQCR